MSVVAIADTTQGIRNAVEEALEITRFSVDSDLPVIIKPNLCCIKSPETGATTDPFIVEALVNFMKDRFGSQKFLIVESHATGLNADLAFRLLGYEKLAKRIGARTVNLTSIPFKIERFPQNYLLHRLKIPVVFDTPHFLISVAKLKTHSLCGFTGTLKNMYGCNPEPLKIKYHPKLHQAIADVASVFRPDFSIVDAVTAMTGSGPVSGTPVLMNKIVAGRDPVAVDTFISGLVGVNPNKVDYLRYSRKLGLGSSQYRLASNVPFELFGTEKSVTEMLVSNAVRLLQVLRRNPKSRY